MLVLPNASAKSARSGDKTCFSSESHATFPPRALPSSTTRVDGYDSTAGGTVQIEYGHTNRLANNEHFASVGRTNVSSMGASPAARRNRTTSRKGAPRTTWPSMAANTSPVEITPGRSALAAPPEPARRVKPSTKIVVRLQCDPSAIRRWKLPFSF